MFKRTLSALAAASLRQPIKERLKMKTWRTHDYGQINNIQLDEIRIPVIRNPSEVLVQVHSASVNPIDILMLGGYGQTLLQIPRNWELELPLTVGRDFSGTIIAKGLGVSDKYKIGDEVYGFVPLYNSGSFAEAVLTNTSHILPKPKHLSHTESTSLVYATMTAWSALFIFGNMITKQRDGLRVLILGGSGGVGTAAIQLLKSQGCNVFTTCSEDAIPLVTKLGADRAFNYNDPNFARDVESEGRYHIILDGAKMGHDNLPKEWKFDTYISLNSPLLKNTDQYGLMGGLVYSFNELVNANLTRYQNGSSVIWGFFVPSSSGFEFINELVLNKKIQPVIHKTFTFEQIPEALQTVGNGHLRGKVIIDYQIPNTA